MAVQVRTSKDIASDRQLQRGKKDHVLLRCLPHTARFRSIMIGMPPCCLPCPAAAITRYAILGFPVGRWEHPGNRPGD